MKNLSTKFAKIDVENDNLEGKQYIFKGERGRGSLMGAIKDKDGNALQSHFVGARGRVDGQDAYCHVTVGELKKELGWWWGLPWGTKGRVMWRVKMIEEEYNETWKNKEWRKKASRSKTLAEGIDYYLGKRVKVRQARAHTHVHVSEASGSGERAAQTGLLRRTCEKQA